MSFEIKPSVAETRLAGAIFPEEPEVVPEPAAPAGKVYLFSLNGVDYFLPERVGPNVSFRYLRDLRKKGPEIAVANLFVALLGEDALDALADADDLTEEDVETVMKAVQRHALGPTEGGRGKSSSARPK